ncbi:hypothetical protein EVAR_13729_1 [Eumeta japonica]|uniref:Uncharacterized protein n=1 Tax=Eumeta variegata TaxID=151549 RepID=A0A4C1UCU0_EUMVA|nr:hypothetical protein EVAR_13729_1 [Eumeta japonica]
MIRPNQIRPSQTRSDDTRRAALSDTARMRAQTSSIIKTALQLFEARSPFGSLCRRREEINALITLSVDTNVPAPAAAPPPSSEGQNSPHS